MPEKEEKVVAFEDGWKHGYVGQVQDETPNEHYTVAGQVEDAAKASDTPKSAARKGDSK